DYHDQNWAYGISKYESECEVWRGLAEGLEVVIVNPTIVLADRDWTQGSGRLFGVVQKGMRFYTPGGNGYVDVRDVSACLIALLESENTEERCNITAESRTMRQTLAASVNVMGNPRPSMQLKRWMLEIACPVNLGYALLTGKEPLLTQEAVPAA